MNTILSWLLDQALKLFNYLLERANNVLNLCGVPSITKNQIVVAAVKELGKQTVSKSISSALEFVKKFNPVRLVKILKNVKHSKSNTKGFGILDLNL